MTPRRCRRATCDQPQLGRVRRHRRARPVHNDLVVRTASTAGPTGVTTAETTATTGPRLRLGCHPRKAGDMVNEVSGRVAYRHSEAGGVEPAVTRGVGDAEGDHMQALKGAMAEPRRSSLRARGERAMLSPENEQRMVVAAEDDLHREFPDVPTEQIHSLVLGIWAGFVTARVREFVPVLVRATARSQLRVRTVPPDLATNRLVQSVNDGIGRGT